VTPRNFSPIQALTDTRAITVITPALAKKEKPKKKTTLLLYTNAVGATTSI